MTEKEARELTMGILKKQASYEEVEAVFEKISAELGVDETFTILLTCGLELLGGIEEEADA